MVRLGDVRRLIVAAEKKAQQIAQPMNIAVDDGSGNIVAHVRMDGAGIGSIDIAQKKAYTSGRSISRPRAWRPTPNPMGSFSEFMRPTTGRS